MKILPYPPSIKQSIFIFFGIIFSLYIFYIRVLLKRAEDLIQYRGSIFLIVLYLILIIIFLLSIKQKIFPTAVSSNIFIRWLTNKFFSLLTIFSNFYNKMCFELYLLLIERHGYNYEMKDFLHDQSMKIHFFVDKYIITVKKSRFLYNLYYIFVPGPYFIFATGLLLDVLVFKKFTCLIFLGWVLILPMVWNCIFFILKTFCDRDWNILSKYFTIVKTFRKNKNGDTIARVSTTFNYDAKIVYDFPITEEQYYLMVENIRQWSLLRDIVFFFYSDTAASPLFRQPFYKIITILTAFFNIITFSYRLWNEIIFLLYPV